MVDEKMETMLIARPDFLSKVKLNYIVILAIFANDQSKFGLTEEEIKEKSLDKENAMAEVADMEANGYVRSFLSQKNDSGPYVRHYKLKDKIEISVTIRKL